MLRLVTRKYGLPSGQNLLNKNYNHLDDILGLFRLGLRHIQVFVISCKANSNGRKRQKIRKIHFSGK